MIDLHIHLLPGIDDGAANWEQSERMCRMAAEDGCRALVATPHQRRRWPNEDASKLRDLLDQLATRIGPQPELHLGGEIHIDSDLLDSLDRADYGGLCPLAGTRWLLLEFDQVPPSQGPEWLVHEVLLAGWRPLIAHPEFIPFLAEDRDLLAQLIRLGARSQVTAMSLTGDFGRATQDTARAMIHADLAHVVASDAHTPEWRPPGLSRARDEITRRWNERLAGRLVESNPLLVLEDEEIPLGQLA